MRTQARVQSFLKMFLMVLASCEATRLGGSWGSGRRKYHISLWLKKCEVFWYIFHLLTLSVPEVIYSLLLSLYFFCLFSPSVPLLLSPLGFLLPDAASLLVSPSLTLYHTPANLWSIINVLQADRVFPNSLTSSLPSLCFFKIPVCGSPESRSTHKSWGTVQHFSREARRHFQPGH